MNHVTTCSPTQYTLLKNRSSADKSIAIKHLEEAGDSIFRVHIPFPNPVAMPGPFAFRSMKSVLST